MDVKSSSIIVQSITNGYICFIKIKNLKYGKYLTIMKNSDAPIQSNTNYDVYDIFGGDCGTMIKMIPCHDNIGFYLCVDLDRTSKYISFDRTNNKFTLIDTRINKEKYVEMYCHKADDKCLLICFDDTLNDINRYGTRGKFLSMSDDMYVFCNGDNTSESSLWSIEKVNDIVQQDDIRNDYIDTHRMLKRDTKKNLLAVFPQLTKKYNIFNVGCKKYLNASIHGIDDRTNNVVFGDDRKMDFILFPNIDDGCVYITRMFDDKLFNLIAFPYTSDVSICNTKCNWTKMYVISHNKDIMFRCFHDGISNNGSYGRFLCMTCNDNIYSVSSEGSIDNAMSKWRLEYIE